MTDDERQPPPEREGGRIPIDKVCVRCGHNLRGQLHDAPCPECGLPASDQTDRFITSERVPARVAVCARCGYDLRATSPGSACPECGLPVSEPTSAYDPLNVMPLPVIRRLRVGAWTCCSAMFASFLVIWNWRAGALATDAAARLLLATTTWWTAGVLIITPAIDRPEGIVHGFHSRGRLRRLARGLQPGWMLAAGLWLLLAGGVATGTWIGLVRSAMIIAMLAGLAGSILLAVVLERLADWTRDETAGKLFSTFQVLLPVTALLTPIVWLMPLNLLQIMFRVGLLLCAVTTMTCFVLALLGLSKSITLSVLHAQEHQERQVRRHRRQMEREEEMDDTIGKIDTPPRAAPVQRKSR